MWEGAWKDLYFRKIILIISWETAGRPEEQDCHSPELETGNDGCDGDLRARIHSLSDWMKKGKIGPRLLFWQLYDSGISWGKEKNISFPTLLDSHSAFHLWHQMFRGFPTPTSSYCPILEVSSDTNYLEKVLDPRGLCPTKLLPLQISLMVML